ncbi:hypothetical protein OH77DRAFT_1366424, partial [Trametes cingulata]
LLLWVRCSLSPQQIRDRILADETFEAEIVAWLESCHTGSFLASTDSVLAERLEDEWLERMPDGEMRRRTRLKAGVRDPATTLPQAPPSAYSTDVSALRAWHRTFEADTDDIVFTSNRHDRNHLHGCWRGYCRARFPRDIAETTQIDRASGAIRFAKSEAWINT